MTNTHPSCNAGSNGRFHSERGVALIIALMSMMLMVALGTALMLMTTTETKITSNYRNNAESLYAADAALERVMEDLLTVPDWNNLLNGTVKSALVDGSPSGPRTYADGKILDLNEIVNMANCQKSTTCSDAEIKAVTVERPWGLNNPRWQLFAYGRLNDVLQTGTINSPYYVVVMVGDDPSDDDNDPLLDGVAGCQAGVAPQKTNSDPPTWDCNPGAGVLALRAEAFGPQGNHKVIELTVARTDTSELERGYTGQRGQDEQNRRARKSAVQSPGKALTNKALNLTSGGIS
jgi:Tfp pilus assembly protein PilX